jgi:hypothetical protein
MLKGPQGQKPPAGMIGAAVKVMRIATGGEAEELLRKSMASELGSRGGRARGARMNAERLAEVAKKAARARWKH